MRHTFDSAVALRTRAKLGRAAVKCDREGAELTSQMIAAGYGDVRPSDAEAAIKNGVFPRGGEALWRRYHAQRTEYMALVAACDYLFRVNLSELQAMRDYRHSLAFPKDAAQ